MSKIKLALGAATCAFMISTLMTASAHAQAQTPPKLSMPKVKVAMVLTELVQNAALFAAVKSGEFAAEGLEVEIINFRSWTEPVQAIAGNAAQFALGAGSLIRAVEGQNAPIRQIAMVSSRFPYDFWVKKDSGITKITDLKGKTIQTVRTGETLDNIWKQVLGAAGMSITDVKRFESFSGFSAIVAGQVDIANLNDSLMAKADKSNLVSLIDYTAWRNERGMPQGVGANLGWGASLKVLQENPDTLRAFVRAMVKATDRLRKDKEFGMSILRDKPFEIEQEVVSRVYDRHKDHWMMRMDLAKGDSAFDAEMVEVVLGLPKGAIPLSKYSADAPVTQALRELNINF
jgi:ABC-type nitrate/sulfonate/bicarbonate transport system substrate-binding protein